MHSWRAILSVLILAGCGHDVPEHEAQVTTDCLGPIKSARFRFAATDFETTCGGGILTGSCYTNDAVGLRVAGDLDVVRFLISGTDTGGPSRYELEMEPPGGRTSTTDRLVWCGWYVDEDLRPREPTTTCSFAPTPCTAELKVMTP